MDAAHLHLIVNHVSIFGLLFGVIALIAAMRRKSADLRMFASGLFILAGIFVVIAHETGEGAEDIVKALGDFDEQIEQHESAAEWAFRSGILVASLAVAVEWAARKRQTWLRRLQWTLLVFAIHGCTVFAATAYQGGMIRHTEIRALGK
jgi:hypothetical protein